MILIFKENISWFSFWNIWLLGRGLRAIWFNGNGALRLLGTFQRSLFLGCLFWGQGSLLLWCLFWGGLALGDRILLDLELIQLGLYFGEAFGHSFLAISVWDPWEVERLYYVRQNPLMLQLPYLNLIVLNELLQFRERQLLVVFYLLVYRIDLINAFTSLSRDSICSAATSVLDWCLSLSSLYCSISFSMVEFWPEK